MTWNLEKQSGAGNGSSSRNSDGSGKVVSKSTARKRSPLTSENIDRNMPGFRSVAKDEKPNGSIVVVDHQTRQVDSIRALEKEVRVANNNTTSVLVAASGGEKENDFFAMKGTKLNVNHEMRDMNLLILIKFNIFITYMES